MLKNTHIHKLPNKSTQSIKVWSLQTEIVVQEHKIFLSICTNIQYMQILISMTLNYTVLHQSFSIDFTHPLSFASFRKTELNVIILNLHKKKKILSIHRFFLLIYSVFFSNMTQKLLPNFQKIFFLSASSQLNLFSVRVQWVYTSYFLFCFRKKSTEQVTYKFELCCTGDAFIVYFNTEFSKLPTICQSFQMYSNNLVKSNMICEYLETS